MPAIEDVLRSLLAMVNDEQRLLAWEALPAHMMGRPETERRRAFEDSTARRIARMMVEKAEWEKRFTVDDRASTPVVEAPYTEQWSCEFVVMTRGQFNALCEMVGAICRKQERQALEGQSDEG